MGVYLSDESGNLVKVAGKGASIASGGNVSSEELDKKLNKSAVITTTAEGVTTTTYNNLQHEESGFSIYSITGVDRNPFENGTLDESVANGSNMSAGIIGAGPSNISLGVHKQIEGQPVYYSGINADCSNVAIQFSDYQNFDFNTSTGQYNYSTLMIDKNSAQISNTSVSSVEGGDANVVEASVKLENGKAYYNNVEIATKNDISAGGNFVNTDHNYTENSANIFTNISNEGLAEGSIILSATKDRKLTIGDDNIPDGAVVLINPDSIVGYHYDGNTVDANFGLSKDSNGSVLGASANNVWLSAVNRVTLSGKYVSIMGSALLNGKEIATTDQVGSKLLTSSSELKDATDVEFVNGEMNIFMGPSRFTTDKEHEGIFMQVVPISSTGSMNGLTSMFIMTDESIMMGNGSGGLTIDSTGIKYNDKKISTVELDIDNITGNSIKFTPNDLYRHKVFSITNQGTIEVEDTSTTCNEYSFELSTANCANDSITMNYVGCEGPMNFEFETYTTYIGKIIDGKVCYIGKFDCYPNKWVYGTWVSDDLTTSFTFNNNFTFSATVSGTKMSGAYSIEDGMLSLDVDDDSNIMKSITKVSDTQITIADYGTLSK